MNVSNKISLLVLLTGFFFCSQVRAEEIRLTTYYPSPRGVYKRLVAREGISFNGRFPDSDQEGGSFCIRQEPGSPNTMQFFAPSDPLHYSPRFEFLCHNVNNNATTLFADLVGMEDNSVFILRGKDDDVYVVKMEMGAKYSDAMPMPYIMTFYNNPTGYFLFPRDPYHYLMMSPLLDPSGNLPYSGIMTYDGRFYIKRHQADPVTGNRIYIDSETGDIKRYFDGEWSHLEWVPDAP